MVSYNGSYAYYINNLLKRDRLQAQTTLNFSCLSAWTLSIFLDYIYSPNSDGVTNNGRTPSESRALMIHDMCICSM